MAHDFLAARPIREDFTKASALREAAGPIMEWAQEIFVNVKRKVWFQRVQKKRGFLGGEEVLKKVLSSLKLTYFSDN